MTLNVLDVLEGRYRIDEPLGSGAMGMVYRAFDLDLERTCCVKVLTGHQRLGREHLRKEGAAVARVSSPHVVSVYSFGSHAEVPYLVLEFVRGRDLRALIDGYRSRTARVPIERAIRIVRELCDGLAAAHAAGVVHRDVKPANAIVEDHTGRSVLVDFGIADSLRSRESRVCGTPSYMAPECFDVGTRPTVAADLYSMGCLAFELFTGSQPFPGSTAAELSEQHRTSPVPRVASLRPALARLQPMFDRLLAKSPIDRPGTATMVVNLLDDLKSASMASVAPQRLVDATTTFVADVSAQSPSVAPASPEPAAGLRVLVVDDDPVFARMAQRCVQIACMGVPLSVSRAGTVSEAIANATAHRPDLVLLDFVLPDGTGLDVLAALHRDLGGARRPEVLVASGSIQASERWRFDVYGVTRFVDKPLDFERLTLLLHEMAVRRGWKVGNVAG